MEVNPAEYFNYEMVAFGADTSPRLPVKVVEEDEEYIVRTTPFGGLRRDHKDYSSTPEIIDWPCKSRDDWERIKERFTPSRDRVDWDGQWLAGTAEDERGNESTLETGRTERRMGLPGWRKARDQDRFIVYAAPFGYDRMQSYVASEELLTAIVTDPEWVVDMYETDATLSIQMYEIMTDGGFSFDGAFILCDLGYRNGLLFSPQHYDEQLRPTFRRLVDYFHDEGLPVILHSCGCVTELIPRFIEDGLDCLQPLEQKAGMDLVELAGAFGDDLAFMGGIDVRTMADPDPTVTEEEIRSKIPAAMQGGGYIYHSDHSVPNDVSFNRYEHVLELVREYGQY
ncbi:MAG: uroporphyrinogen decarboxylase family protein [Armatimonadota bacterium]|nr:uroporphyrinogen decarboxylase family protein [Armatimonadota bacterium]